MDLGNLGGIADAVKDAAGDLAKGDVNAAMGAVTSAVGGDFDIDAVKAKIMEIAPEGFDVQELISHLDMSDLKRLGDIKDAAMAKDFNKVVEFIKMND